MLVDGLTYGMALDSLKNFGEDDRIHCYLKRTFVGKILTASSLDSWYETIWHPEFCLR